MEPSHCTHHHRQLCTNRSCSYGASSAHKVQSSRLVLAVNACTTEVVTLAMPLYKLTLQQCHFIIRETQKTETQYSLLLVEEPPPQAEQNNTSCAASRLRQAPVIEWQLVVSNCSRTNHGIHTPSRLQNNTHTIHNEKTTCVL